MSELLACDDDVTPEIIPPDMPMVEIKGITVPACYEAAYRLAQSLVADAIRIA